MLTRVLLVREIKRRCGESDVDETRGMSELMLVCTKIWMIYPPEIASMHRQAAAAAAACLYYAKSVFAYGMRSVRSSLNSAKILFTFTRRQRQQQQPRRKYKPRNIARKMCQILDMQSFSLCTTHTGNIYRTHMRCSHACHLFILCILAVYPVAYLCARGLVSHMCRDRETTTTIS